MATIEKPPARRNRGAVVARAVARWMVANPVAVGAAVILVLGTGAWTSLETFYRGLGATPDEVGVGAVSQPVIAGTAIGLVFLVGASLALYALLLLVAGYWAAFRDTLTIVAWVRRRSEQAISAIAQRRWVQIWGLARGLVWLITATVIVISLGVLFSIFPNQADKMARDVTNGRLTVGVYLGWIDVLPVRAVPVDIARVGGATPAYDNQCLMLLGSNNGTTVFYDASRDTTLRMPSSTVEVVGDENSASACQQLATKHAPTSASPPDLRLPFAVAVGLAGTALLGVGALLLLTLIRAPLRATYASTGSNFLFADFSVGLGLLGLALLVGLGVGLASPAGMVVGFFLLASHTALYLTYQPSA